ncbi:MAG: FCD domain-containing protein [Ancalomicrobiaceae bacterium]|nr:FCD domain-containing protein [Ancalomicrobiaceae bacterium]
MGKADGVESDLRRRLAAGEWQPGEQLPDERGLARHYGVARNTVRKAIARLQSAHLVDRHVGRGTTARDRPDEQTTRMLKRFTDASPADILNLRLFIEPHAAAAAARNLSDEDFAAIAAAATGAEAAGDLEAYERWDNEFHRLINSAAGSRFLSDFFALLTIIRYTPTMMEIRRQWFTEDRRTGYNQEHRAILSALQDWDSERAASAMREHLLSRRRAYFGQ